jgi:hypothetical protein
MDMRTVFELEAQAEYEATREAFVRLAERRAHRRRVLRWWNPLVQVVIDPAVAMSTPEEFVGSPLLPASGVDIGAAGSSVGLTRPRPPKGVVSPPARRPGAPTLDCSEATRISGQRT